MDQSNIYLDMSVSTSNPNKIGILTGARKPEDAYDLALAKISELWLPDNRAILPLPADNPHLGSNFLADMIISCNMIVLPLSQISYLGKGAVEQKLAETLSAYCKLLKPDGELVLVDQIHLPTLQDIANLEENTTLREAYSQFLGRHGFEVIASRAMIPPHLWAEELWVTAPKEPVRNYEQDYAVISATRSG